ncbi:MAG: metallophosphoesterase family protein [Proteobacteria bacterium]|nr:metallophosphoesterase family protein [Pseudomonadota bacterium]
MLVGVLSDTHGYVDPQISEIFRPVRRILHAGDFEEPAILSELEKIAPVTAVRGNGDYQFRELYPTDLVIEINEFRILLCHRYNSFTMLEPRILSEIERVKPQVLVYGHTHDHVLHQSLDILYLNPGYAGKKDYPGRYRSVALLDLSGLTPRGEIIPLD